MAAEKENIFDSIEEHIGEYAELLLKALEDGLSAIKQVYNKGGYVGKYYDFPTVSYGKNGLPSFSNPFGSGPTDYRDYFRSFGRSEPKVDERGIESFARLVDFVRKHPKLHHRFTIDYTPPPDADIDIKIDEINIISGIKDSIDRYIHSNSSYEYDKKSGVEAIAPTLAYIFNKNLDIEICVPILFLQFPFDEYQISDGACIRRISDKEHQARYGVESYNTSAHKSVKSSATHAFVLNGWHVPNAERMWDFDVLSKPRAYPQEQINNFFGALRIATKANTGYAQIYSIAKGWAVHNKSDLPYAQGATVRSYPGWFEDYYWNIETVPSISNEEMDQISTLYKNIESATENSIHLSIKRLNQCLVRDNEEDSVLDATIALEALLSDDGNQEMTHKLAMRIGALSRLEKSYYRTPFDSFGDVKKIYAYRSAIVHGSKGLEKKKVIKIDDDNEVNTHVLAVEYLRMVLRVVLNNSDYRLPRNIDEKLLLNYGIENA